MIRRSSQPLCAWFLTCDLLVTAVAWVGAYRLRLSGWLPVTKTPPDVSLCWGNLPLVILLAAVAFHYAGQYQVHRLRRFREEMVAVCKGALLLALLVMATTFFLRDPYESRAIMLIFTVLTVGGVLVARRLTWSAIRRLRSRGFNQTRALVVGTGRIARRTAKALRHASWMGIRNVGFIEDRANCLCGDLPVLGGPGDLPDLIERFRIEHVFIALPLNRYLEARKVFDVLSQTMAEVRLIVDVPGLAGLSLTTTNLDGLPVVGLRESPHFGLNLWFKRVLDVTLSAGGLVLLAPLLALIAWAVRRSSPGPVFYRQERCGLNGRSFWMLKFRTMPVDAETTTGPVWAVPNDPRRTRLGAFLRSTSLDELPQLWNVLRGDMSLVGPRPERPEFIRQFRRTVPSYMARHRVKAGITGWAQVHGWRGNTSLRKRVQYDLYYITHWTPWLDVRILWMTIFRVLRHRNAY
jgi:exopolysaccharide biosynthesis polyprenyl glycosylphosphotransferase